jgi:uncharacterized CHY-type Zn-finger protein
MSEARQQALQLLLQIWANEGGTIVICHQCRSFMLASKGYPYPRFCPMCNHPLRPETSAVAESANIA